MNLITILIAIVVFSLLIFVHELGHFLAAKSSGIKVNEFALGMGPKLLSWRRKETDYSLRLFPIGGFCAMEGENEESEESGAFCNAPLSRRILVTIAGSLMNLLLGLVLVGILCTQISAFGTTTVREFKEGAVSSEHLRVGDRITKIDGHRVRTVNDLDYEFSRSRDGVMDIQVIRDGEMLDLPGVTFAMQEIEGIRYIFQDFQVQWVKPGFGSGVRYALNWTGSLVKQVWGSFIDLVTGRYTVNQLSGPVGVTTAISQASSMGWKSLVLLVSIITLNLGVFNLLPVPALDGGRLIFLLVELVRRKPVPPRYEGVIHAIGFLLLIGLMVMVTINDVLRLI